MKIAISGAQKTGKSLFINEFLRRWPMYVVPGDTYRDKILPGNLRLNRDGDEQSQGVIRDALCDQVSQYHDQPFVLHDRCVLDNLAYSAYLYDQGKCSDAFMEQSWKMASVNIKLLDVIFYFPVVDESDYTHSDAQDNPHRDADADYQRSIDSIFQAFEQDNIHRKGWLFDPADAPPMIQLPGDVAEKITHCALYIDADGNEISTGINFEDELQRIKSEHKQPLIYMP